MDGHVDFKATIPLAPISKITGSTFSTQGATSLLHNEKANYEQKVTAAGKVTELATAVVTDRSTLHLFSSTSRQLTENHNPLDFFLFQYTEPLPRRIGRYVRVLQEKQTIH